jgi:integral membrane protein
LPGSVERVNPGVLTWYRVMAWVTGVMLLVLVFVAMPMKYIGDDPTLVRVVGIAHGWLYVVYVLSALTLAYQARWRPLRTLLVVLAGTIPFASFVAERKVVAAARREHQDEPVDA